MGLLKFQCKQACCPVCNHHQGRVNLVDRFWGASMHRIQTPMVFLHPGVAAFGPLFLRVHAIAPGALGLWQVADAHQN